MNAINKPGVPHIGKYVAYYRVSTKRQGGEGLGINAQRNAVHTFLNGGTWELLGEFTEVESARMKKRPRLEEALALCKKSKATLVIARLDRLYRNVAATALLLESKVTFICCDMPQADKMMVQMVAVFAEREAKIIGERTTAALAGIKRTLRKEGHYISKRGTRIKRLGNTVNPTEAAKAGRKILIAQADEYAAKVMPIVRELNKMGYATLRDIARGLAMRGVETRRGSTSWGPSQVANLLKRRA